MVVSPLRIAPVRRGASRRVLAGVACATMLALLLFDVRVEVGKTPASAEREPSEQTSTAQLSPTPTPPRARAEGSTRERSRAIERRFAWAPVPGASGYHVEFFRGTTRVFAQPTARPELTVPSRWTYQDAERSFRQGRYRWYVWPLIAGKRQSRAVVQTTVTIPSG
jgi:hypothetical protein